MAQRTYDIVLFGAGYTGRYTAEHIVASLPTDLSWAIAGRSEDKLLSLAKSLKDLNPDRKQPGTEVSRLNANDLNRLAGKTRLLINCVGPYCVYGTPVVDACVAQKTHYLDATGEAPWVKEITTKYHIAAKSSGTIVIPEIGLESAPPDLMVYQLAQHVRSELGLPLQEVILTVHEMKASASGGTLATVRELFQHYSLTEIASASKPDATCPIQIPKHAPPPLKQRLLGFREAFGLEGTLTTSLQGFSDTPIVYRSWGLFASGEVTGESYGPNFRFSPHLTVRNKFVAVMVHISLVLMPFLLVLSPVRWLMSKLVFKPGHGPSRQDVLSDKVELRALSFIDSDTPRRGFARFRFLGSVYQLTGILLAQGAATILYDNNPSTTFGGGVLTPAALGDRYIDRLSNVGVVIETKTLD